MTKPSKESIINAYNDLAREKGISIGERVFQRETGISHYYWKGGYWRSWTARVVLNEVENRSILIHELFETKELLPARGKLLANCPVSVKKDDLIVTRDGVRLRREIC